MWIYLVLGPVQTLLHSCAKPNWWIKYGKKAASESIWQKRLLRQTLTETRHTVSRLNQMSPHCRSKVELIQLGSAHEEVRRLNQALHTQLLHFGFRFISRLLNLQNIFTSQSYQPKITWQYSSSSSSSQFLSKFIFRVVLFIWSFAAIFSVLVWLLIDDLP